MTRGRGFSSSRGPPYRGNSHRGGGWGNSRGGGYGGAPPSGSRFAYSDAFDSRSKPYSSSAERYQSSRNHSEEYKRSYRPESSIYGGRDGHRSPERKRMRPEPPSSHRDSYGGSENYQRYESSYPERRSFSDDRRPPPVSRREDFRKPPPPSPRGSYRGRLGSRGGPLRSRLRERPIRRRLVDSSYSVRRRAIRSTAYERKLKLAKLRSEAQRYSKKKKEGSDKEDSKEVEAETDKADKTEGTEETKEENAEGGEEQKSPKKSPKKEGDKSEKEDRKEITEDEDSKPKRKFIVLRCPHCLTKCPTFRSYSIHLKGSRHMSTMRRIAMKQKGILSQMRLAQRNAQRELEKNAEDLAPRTNFCPLCKLNYKQLKSVHQASDAHKNMKKFLMPYCKICKVTLKSPMLYEDHLCSIDHIKRKSLLTNGDKSEENSGDDDNLENFMTIDSVGDVDEEDGEEKKKEKSEEPPKEKINVGVESIHKVEVHYCDLCRMYLPRVSDEDVPKILSKHCRMRTHLQRYIRFKEDKDLTKRAERLQRKEIAEKKKEDKKSDVKNEESPTKETKTENQENMEEDETGDDKLWADVDKDLGAMLAEAESGNKSSDEDDNGERYDRFKLSNEKNGEGKGLTENDVAETEDLKVDDTEEKE